MKIHRSKRVFAAAGPDAAGGDARFQEIVEIPVDCNVEITEDSFELNNGDISFLEHPFGKDGNYYSERFPQLKLTDAEHIYDNIDSILEFDPDITPGTYNLSCTLVLVYDCVVTTQTDDVDDVDAISSSEVKLNLEDSHVDNFTLSAIAVNSAETVPDKLTDVIYAADEDEDESSEWVMMDSKDIVDEDGMYTEYTLYRNADGTKFICMFGDRDIYGPDEDYADWEGDSEEEALEWFRDYTYLDPDDIYGADEAQVEEEVDEDENAVRPQKYSSKKTAVNYKSGKVPAIFNKISWQPGTINLDYGGGTEESEAIANGFFEKKGLDVQDLVYDKFNVSPEHRREVIQTIKENGGADTATLSNVLNVIEEPEVRQDILNHIKKLLKPGGTLYIYSHEGSKEDRERGARATADDQYQLFRTAEEYMDEIREVFPNAQRKGRLITAVNASTSVEAGRLIFPWQVEGEFEDGFRYTATGDSEAECVEKLMSMQDKHGDLTWYSEVADADLVTL